jgi:hypothetical protein
MSIYPEIFSGAASQGMGRPLPLSSSKELTDPILLFLERDCFSPLLVLTTVNSGLNARLLLSIGDLRNQADVLIYRK